MANKHTFLAFDIGASSGRSVIGEFQGGKLELHELTRFSNNILNIHGNYYWNIYSLFEKLKEALLETSKQKIKLDAIGIDTWGVDFVCLSDMDTLIGLPRSYRDPYTIDAPQKLFEKISGERLYEITGIQMMNFNTLFQLCAQKEAEDFALRSTSSILFIPDALSFLLTGEKVCEYTIASTSQLLDSKSRQIAPQILEVLDIKNNFPSIVEPGCRIGSLHPAICKECNIDAVPVLAVAGHDTASAVVAVPANDSHFAYISSGTWSLMGIEVEKPIITAASHKNNFTNEGGVDGTIRFLKNIAGMWLLEECRREWEKEDIIYSYEEIVRMAQSVDAFQFLIDPDDPIFSNPPSMLAAIKEYCVCSGQREPESIPQIVRCIFDSLALKYKYTFDILQSMAPFRISKVHVIGGGSKNEFLNQITANALNIPVISGPSEATAIGNVMMQAKGMGLVTTLSEIRKVVRASLETKIFEPKEHEVWRTQYESYKALIKQTIKS